MDFITYGLFNSSLNSDEYYREAASLTDQILIQAEVLLHDHTYNFQSFLTETNRENLRSNSEYYLELLVLGTLWHVYGGLACLANSAPLKTLSFLSDLRQQSGFFKPGADFCRGILFNDFLVVDQEKFSNKMQTPEPTFGNFKKLLRWLAATGEFNQEVKHLWDWRDYFRNQPSAIVSEVLTKAIEFARWFEMKSQEILGKYTGNVNQFLSDYQYKHLFHEDIIFCGRRQVEYHLNMVGAEIMNRAFRKEFLTKERKILLLPSCMRENNWRNCKAIKTSLGSQCVQCTHGCHINKLTRMGVEYNFEVYIVAHESSVLANYTAKPEIKTNMGIIGVACVLNLIAGGWKVKAVDIPPQCVLLDYCGCKNHWHDEGIPTNINTNQLLKILNKK